MTMRPAAVLALLGALTCAAPAHAGQARLLPPAPVPQPPAPPPAGPLPSPASLRPRAVAVMTLESSAFADGGLIPAAQAQTGRDVSPPLNWSGAPEGTATFVLVVRDLDAVAPGGGDDLLHWLVWNIPGTTTSLPAGVPEGNAPEPPRGGGAVPRPPTDRLRQISATGPNYRGPAAPASGPMHHYVFELYALDVWLDVPAVGQSPAATRAAVMAAMAGHVRGKAVLTGRYRRPAP
jgi:Raf kinase inhibitor-like YbhB/YbcL family protein